MVKPAVSILAGAAALSALLFRLLERARMMPEAASLEAARVDHAFGAMLTLTIPIFAVVVCCLLYALVSFRGKEGEEGAAFDRSPGRMVETLWITASIVLTLGLAAYGSQEFLLIRGGPQADLDVQIKGAQWSWEFYYPDRKVNAAELILPKGKRARISITSEDVVHSFWVPAFRLKQDALPGRVTTLYVTPVVTGEYDVICAELCGLDHSVMRGKVLVVEPEEFAAHLKGEAW